jgi:MarR family transcriptional regulator for hemolysin
MPLVAQLNRQWRRVIDRKLQPLGLTEAMWLPLLHLSRASRPMRQKDLAASLSLDSSSVVRLLDGLEVNQFVERVEGADRRAKEIHLTPLGVDTVRSVEDVVDRARAELLADVPAEDLDAALRVLERVARSLSVMEQEGT